MLKGWMSGSNPNDGILINDKVEILLKIINLVDNDIVDLLYKASLSGVKIRIIVRGMCFLFPGVAGAFMARRSALGGCAATAGDVPAGFCQPHHGA